MSALLNPQEFADYCWEHYKENDGYIMGSIGQDPRKWAPNSWWYTQYSGSQRAKALYWRENAPHVFDCQGMEDGFETLKRGVTTNVRARNNYADYCATKGKGTIPPKYRVPGAAVFMNDSYIHHVGFLIKPVDAKDPDGDWYVIEARGVMYGVKMYKLSQRGWNRWGLMDKRFDYTAVLAQYHGEASVDTPTTPGVLGSRDLRNGSKGADVTEMQTVLLQLGYELPVWGADGDFGDETEAAVRAFQQNSYDLKVDGVYGENTHAALMGALSELPHDDGHFELPARLVRVTKAGRWNVRNGPGTNHKILTVVSQGVELPYVSEADNGWLQVEYNGTTGWISGVCAEVSA